MGMETIAPIAEAVTAFVTAALAIATVGMARQTKVLANETRALANETGEALVQSDRQHQETLMPLLKLREVISGGVASAQNMTTIAYNWTVVNSGSGPALSSTFRFVATAPNDEARVLVEETFALPPLGAGEEHRLNKSWDVFGRFTEYGWTMTLTYKNVFGSDATTSYQHDANAPTFTPPQFRPRQQR